MEAVFDGVKCEYFLMESVAQQTPDNKGCSLWSHDKSIAESMAGT